MVAVTSLPDIPEHAVVAAASIEEARVEQAPAPIAVPVAEQAMPETPAEAETTTTVEAPAPVTAAAEVPPAVDLSKTLQESGLVLVQTDPSKLKPVEQPVEATPVPRQPRPRRPPPPDTGPLLIVETRRDN